MLLGDILELNALRAPERLALVAGEQSYLFGDLHDRSQRLASALAGLAGGAPGAVAYDELVASVRAEPPALDRPGDDEVAWQLYTSGTTGRPKGAMLTHRSLITALHNAAMAYDVKADDRAMLCFPMCHVAGYLVTLNHMAGASVLLMRAYDPQSFMRLVDEHGITSTGLAPTMMTVLLQHPKIDEFNLSTLTSIGYGAAAMPVEVLKRAIKRFGPVVWSGFGMTELGGNVLTHPIAAHVRAVNGEEHLLAACGVPMTFAVARVVDEDMVELAPGEVGEIVIKGDQLLQGYWNRPEATEEAFRGGWFHTGDMAYRDSEGFFYIVDRKKDMIITGGENVYSREVEEVLYAHPAVAEAAVIGLPDAVWGERVTAVVALRAGRRRRHRRSCPRAATAWPGSRRPRTCASSTSCRRTSAARSSSASCATGSERRDRAVLHEAEP
jgi:acyl-CoA synthetase (AMP-forming)/AMP-acid ligase II